MAINKYIESLVDFRVEFSIIDVGKTQIDLDIAIIKNNTRSSWNLALLIDYYNVRNLVHI